MQCPVCRKHTMSATEVAPKLTGSTCSACAGTWIPRSHYDAWRATQPGDTPASATPVQIAVTDVHASKLCPQCGHLLLPYRVGHGLTFSIDHCGACGGVWLDRNEWDAIRAKNLHDNLHEIVSAQWQSDVRRAEVRDAIEQFYVRQLGGAYAKAREVREWLRSQTEKGVILAYLAERTRND
jgi:Zn-finger nucleic acid-binding protein